MVEGCSVNEAVTGEWLLRSRGREAGMLELQHEQPFESNVRMIVGVPTSASTRTPSPLYNRVYGIRTAKN
jgi:hypothetical protein